ncbi:MAG: HutD family protein, partial [Nannocystaceae bacterium]|nr:HutD family protein [Nannocystaceae bacterium]
MFNIISPDRFKTIPWKNGQGVTSELAVSQGHGLADFTWRISIAQVDKDGAFSDFTGLHRTLVLLEGRGLELCHDDKTRDRLERPLDLASFDGGSRTVGRLISGPITDFNVMSRVGRMSAEVGLYRERAEVEAPTTELGFVYCALEDADICDAAGGVVSSLPVGHLLRGGPALSGAFTVRGRGLIS